MAIQLWGTVLVKIYNYGELYLFVQSINKIKSTVSGERTLKISDSFLT